MNHLRRIYHHLLPPALRGPLGVGLWLSHRLQRDQFKLVFALFCNSPFSSGDIRQRAELTIAAAGSCYSNLLQFLNAYIPLSPAEFPCPIEAMQRSVDVENRDLHE